MRLLPFLTILLIFASQSSAIAKAQINDEGASKVKQLVQNFLDEKTSINVKGQRKLIADGEIKVEQAENYYAVTLPDISIISKNNKSAVQDNLITKIGIIGLNVSPTDNPKEWTVAVAIPTPLKLLNSNKQNLGEVTIGTQQVIGTWSEDLNAFSKFNGTYTDLKVKKETEKSEIHIEKIKIKTNIEQSNKSKNLWSGPSKVDVSNISFGNLEEGKYVSGAEIANVNVIANVKDFSPYTQDKITHMATQVKEVSSSATVETATPFMLPILDIFDSSAVKITLGGLNISPDKNPLTNTPIKLKEAFIGIGINGLKDRMLGSNVNIGWHGLSGVEQQNDTPIPTTGSFSANLKRLPLQPFIDFVADMSNIKTSGGSPQMAMMNAAMTLPKKLSDAGATLSIKNTALKHPKYALSVNGEIKASQNSIIGLKGEYVIHSSGIQNAIELLKKQRGGASQEKLIRINDIISKLELLQNLSVSVPGSANVKEVKITLDDQGQTLINGVELQQALANASLQ